MNSNSQAKQNVAILGYLAEGRSLTSTEALYLFNCWRLAARIYDLRKIGYPILTYRIKTHDGKQIAKYVMP